MNVFGLPPQLALFLVIGAVIVGCVLDLLPRRGYYSRWALTDRPVLPSDRPVPDPGWDLRRIQQQLQQQDELTGRTVRGQLTGPRRMIEGRSRRSGRGGWEW